MARDESKRDCSTCVYGDNGTNPDGCPETCLEPELPDYEPMPEEQSPRCCKCSGELEKPAEVASKRDETRDVALSKLLNIGGPRKLDGGPFTVWNWDDVSSDDGWIRYAPHDQLAAAERERDKWKTEAHKACIEMAKARESAIDSNSSCVIAWAVSAEFADEVGGQFARLHELLRKAVHELGKFEKQGSLLEAAQKRIAELEGLLTNKTVITLPTLRCKDGCESWFPNMFLDHGGGCNEEHHMPIDGSGFCSNHTRLQK